MTMQFSGRVSSYDSTVRHTRGDDEVFNALLEWEYGEDAADQLLYRR